MRAVVIGGGLAGLTAAYSLSRRGVYVDLIERHNGPAPECSRANGGQLSYSHSEPWCEPGMGLKALRYLLTPQSPFKISSLAHDFPHWALKFLASCNAKKFDQSRNLLSTLAFQSRSALRAWLEYEGDAEGKRFAFANAGIRHIARSAKEYDVLLRHAEAKPDVPSYAERAKDLPPELHGKKIYGAVFYPMDDTGDILLFCRWLERRMKRSGKVHFYYRNRVERFVKAGKHVRGVVVQGGELLGEDADVFVVCSGAGAKRFTDLPLYPVKGYSLTYEAPRPDKDTAYGLTDPFRKVVFSRLGPALRLAGMADIQGFDTTPYPGRINVLRKHAERLFPEIVRHQEPSLIWSCLRPFLPDGLPAIGRAPYGAENVYVHTGHGSLGWTLCAGTAERLSDIIANQCRENPLTSPARFFS